MSIFAVQFAKAAGAKVIATTSSAEKGEKLKALGADHVLNYKEDSSWGETAKKLTEGAGVQHVVEVGGPNTMKQSLQAIAIDGVISVIGFIGGAKGEDQPTMLDALTNICTIRGVLVGSRKQFEAMNRAIEANGIKPVIDEKVFKLEDLKEAYQVSLRTDEYACDNLTDLASSTCGTKSTSQRSAFKSIRFGMFLAITFSRRAQYSAILREACECFRAEMLQVVAGL